MKYKVEVDAIKEKIGEALGYTIKKLIAPEVSELPEGFIGGGVYFYGKPLKYSIIWGTGTACVMEKDAIVLYIGKNGDIKHKLLVNGFYTANEFEEAIGMLGLAIAKLRRITKKEDRKFGVGEMVVYGYII